MKDLIFPARDPEVEEELRLTRPFFWFLIAVLVGYYLYAVIVSPHLHAPLLFIPFTLLMLVHIWLHWISPYLILDYRRLLVYLAVQLLIVLALSFIGRNQGLTMALYMAMAGETIGVLEDWSRSLLAALGYLGLLSLTLALIWGWQAVPTWLIITVPALAFIMIYVMLFVRQIQARSEAQRLLQELETAHRQLAEYAQQVESLTLTTERQRMARELHDTLAQGLAGLVLQLEALEYRLERGEVAQAAAVAAQAKGRARTTLADARSAIDDLRAAGTESPREAITREAERFAEATGIPCTVSLPAALALPPETAAHVVRCVGEGLANVARHARATRVWVTVAAENGRLQVEVGDDGCGFDVDAIPKGHYGLVGLRERARLAGGTLQVKSQPGEGTTLLMSVPL